MKKEFKSAIEEYQCPGCISGCDIKCFEPDSVGGVGCGKHLSGTIISGIGSILLGMPKGFNRLGKESKLKPNIYESFESSDWNYDLWNRPAWKYLNEAGHTFVRGIMPRLNRPFLHIYLEDCMSKIYCQEVTQEDVDAMD